MTTKTVHAFHPTTRAYVGPVELREDHGDMDPMEPGRWLIPGGCLESAPPVAPEGQEAYASGSSWALRAVNPTPLPTQPDPLTPEQQMQAVEDAIQGYMDSVAQMLGYDDIKTAVTYADEPAVPKFQAEGQALRAWRSLVWAACYAHLALVQAGEAEIPTLEEAIAMLPLFTPPAGE